MFNEVIIVVINQVNFMNCGKVKCVRPMSDGFNLMKVQTFLSN